MSKYKYDSINVRDFGAKGNGKTDDTKAIQAAFDAAGQESTVGHFGESSVHEKHDGIGILAVGVSASEYVIRNRFSVGEECCYSSVPEVIFPVGAYIISASLNVDVPIIRGEGDASILQTGSENDIFYYPGAWHGKVSGLTFLGGKTQLNLWNKNLDTGHFSIMDCKFHHSTGPAVQFRKGSNSTFLIIKDCVFTWCRQALISYTDWTTMRDTWIRTDPRMDHMAVIENRGAFMTLDNLLGVPRPSGIDQRWVDNYCDLHCVGCRFGGEGGGFTPVVNFAKFAPQAGGNRVVIDDSWISAESNYKRKCAVYCEEIPNGITIRNSVVLGVPPIKVDKKIDLNNYFRGAKQGMLKYTANDCYGEFTMEIPELLKNPIIAGGKEPLLRLPEKETAKALAAAVKAVRAKRWPAAGALEYQGHKARTAPGQYISITPEKYNFDLSDYMDGTRESNENTMAVAQAGEKIIMMLRQGGGHVLIRNIKVNLDQYPCLSWRILDAQDGTPNSHAVRVIDTESERMALLCGPWHGIEYQAYNVKDALGVAGERTLNIRFYPGFSKYILATKTEPFKCINAKAGEYIVLDFMRFEV